ncbi:uncharacterized protein LOC105193440 [Solenopsis invicta]|uniref:uncharacterized protein LOC105193440 n=1 Tax=Solenopsis invicta TaxID=13686 RepID=UPI000E33DA83|nr:uncharacterized protein LOC105193440 [Solenopsis invicta]
MRSYTLVFVALATVLLCTEYVNAMEIWKCPQENCLVPEKCDIPIRDQSFCHEQGTACCNVVKSEYRTHCHQHGGECMDTCATALQRNTVDCTGNQVCCVLL